MQVRLSILLYCVVIFAGDARSQAHLIQKDHIAPAPLFRDPITDGAADPVLVWNRQEQKWWMLYTQRRANTESPDVAYCYGNDIGIAS